MSIAVPVPLKPEQDDPPTPAGNGWLTPWRLLALLAALVNAFVWGIHPFRDADVFWHVRLGEEILRTGDVWHAGASWSYTMADHSWTTTQWLSEVSMALAYRAAGWPGIALLRLVLVTAFLLLLARTVLSGRRSAWASIVYCVAVSAAGSQFVERPQLASLVLVAWWSAAAYRLLRGEQALPWTAVAVTWVWANLHGAWIVVPAVIALIVAGRVIERFLGAGEGPPPRVLVGQLAATIVVGVLTPVGPRMLVTPLLFARASRQITEWFPTTLDTVESLTFAALLASVVVGWARLRDRVSPVEVVFVIGVAGFGFAAMRNVVPALVLLAPLAVERLERLHAHRDEVQSVRERSVLRGVAVVASVLGAGAVAFGQARTPDVPADAPVPLARSLSQLPGTHHVLNAFDSSGVLVFWGGAGTKVAVDGRVDRYGATWLADYGDLLETRGAWRDTLRRLDPDTAVLRRGMPLTDELLDRRWSVVGEHAGMVLLVRPQNGSTEPPASAATG